MCMYSARSKARDSCKLTPAGYMIVNLLVRDGQPLVASLEAFAKCRSPGIYKDDYIRNLFTYYHERR